MIPLPAPLVTAFAVTATVASLGLLIRELVHGYRRQVGARLSEEFGRGTHKSAERASLFKDLSRLAREADTVHDSFSARLELMLEQADLAASPRQLLSGGFLGGALLALVILVSTESVAGACACFLAGAAAPFAYALFRKRQRIERLRRQLPDAFEIMSRSIRAGQTVPRAFQVVADDFESPLADEFGWCSEQQNLGLPQEVALRDLARRTGVTELQMLVVALIVQRQSGGSPVELLDNLAKVVRKRIRLRERVKALTAEGRMQALVLLCLPPLVLGIISVTNADYVQSLWRQPWLLAAMAVSEVLGALWIRRIITFRY
jgi:tight adherence protein B